MSLMSYNTKEGEEEAEMNTYIALIPAAHPVRGTPEFFLYSTSGSTLHQPGLRTSALPI